MSKEDVIVAIRRAFAETRRPDLHDFVHCEQCEIFLGSLLDSCPERWQDIRSEDISRESSALTAVTPLGWRFLLPAYMLWHLQQYDQKTDANTVDNLVWNLTWDEDKDEHIVDGFRSLSRQQAAAVDASSVSSKLRVTTPVSLRTRRRLDSCTGRAQSNNLGLLVGSPTGHAVMYWHSIRIELAGGASENAA